ncbi:MAG: response regulator [Chloroflexi bacterium]|nr:MAG: response regulator [Chloroflexota bacterium]
MSSPERGDLPSHLVQFYEHEPFLYQRVSDFVEAGLDAAAAAVLIATRPHRDGIAAHLAQRGVDVTGLAASGRYHALDAEDTLSQLMVAGWPDPRRFSEVVGTVIRTARGPEERRVLAFGEMVALLCARGNREAAVRLEELWNELARTTSFSLFCAYPISTFDDAAHAKALAEISLAHGAVIPAESYARVKPDEQSRVVVALQQKAEALENEMRQRAALEAALRSTIEELAEMDRRKDEFLAMLGHELRNPLAPITTALQLMSVHSEEPNRVARSREIIERQISHMTRLIDDLLDVSRITRGKIELREQAVLLSALVERAVEIARPLIDERGHRLSLDLPEEPITFIADPARLEQVLANLLNNAAKYTDVGGRIWVTARRERAELVLSVRDDGPGLSRSQLEDVFDLFAQGPDARARARGGLGIGLTLARRLVQMHGGDVTARSDGEGTGAEFIVRMPIRAPRGAADGSGIGWESAATSGPRRRVLVVDDNVDAAEALAELMRDYGHDVSTAHDGRRAVEEARLHAPELVLLDISMPEMDGYDVAKRIREDVGLHDAILVALTGYGEDRHRRQAREAGFDHHVTKPVDASKLEQLLKLPL